MKKVFHFDAPRERYVCDAAVIWCFDDRFELTFRKFLKRAGISRPDRIRIGGGAKSLASPKRESDREFVLEQVGVSMSLHATRKAILMTHSDCGAYGGLARFGGDTQAEVEHHRAELEKAVSVMLARFPQLEVQAYFVDFEGVWAV